jgi:formylglycine-generating enzyme required for sulfatase activity
MPNSLIEIPMVEIPEGTFMMGRRQDQLVYSNDELPLHEVTLRGFYMSRYLITQAQWRVVATNLPKVDIDLKPSPSRFKGDHKPVEKVSWYEAVEFCNRLTLYTGDSYSLPSESQWEYACRAGTETNFHFGNEAKPDLLNYFMADTEEAGTTIVGSYPPNPFGLYDMHGNVWEWCLDDWHSDYFEAPTDGSPRLNESDKALLRGGSWYSPSRVNRSGFRNHMIRKEVSGTTGFRITHEQ